MLSEHLIWIKLSFCLLKNQVLALWNFFIKIKLSFGYLEHFIQIKLSFCSLKHFIQIMLSSGSLEHFIQIKSSFLLMSPILLII